MKYRIVLEVDLDQPIEDAEEGRVLCAAIESMLQGDAFNEAMAGTDLDVEITGAVALQPVEATP